MAALQTLPAVPRQKPTKAPLPWHAYITLDLLADVANRSFLHPFIAWLMPLCLRALNTPTTWLRYQVSVAYAVCITLVTIALHFGRRLAYGVPRQVDLADEVIVVTGGASGLGLLVAEVYGMRGASVAALDVRPEEEVGDELEGKGITYYRCDVGDRAAVERAAERIREDLGTPTILINNAGIVTGKPLLAMSAAEAERSLRVNLLAHFHTLQTFLPGMLARPAGGTVVTVSSVLGKLGAACLSDYTAAKAGLLALHNSLVAELRQSSEPGAKNVRTILATPGQLGTPLFGAIKTPSSFLAPIVEPVQVAQAIIKMVDAGEGGEISFPLYARWIEWMQVLPAGAKHIVRQLSGLDSAMATFDTNPGKKSQ